MTGYCKYCNSLIDEGDIIKAFDSDTHLLVWVGCFPCYKKRIELMNSDKKQV